MSSAAEHSRFASIFAAGTLLSRVLGLVRDQIWMALLPSASRDAFILAFKFPNMLREIIGEGASNAAFIPTFAESLEKESHEEFQRLVSAVMSAMLVLLGLLTVGGIAILPTIIESITFLDTFTRAPAVSPEKLELVSSLSMWTFPYLFFICMSVFCMAPLFTLKHYTTPSWSPALLNVAFIVSVLLFRDAFAEPAYALVLGAWLGGTAQLVVQYIALAKVSGVRFPNFQLAHPGIRKVLFLLIPVLIGQSAGEVNRLVDALFAYSLEEGTVSSLFIANRLLQLPLSIFGVATSIAILPALSRLHSKKDVEGLQTTLRQGLRQSFYFIMPAMVGLFILGQPVISLLFEWGEFDSIETARAASALACYAGGLLAFAWVKVLVTGFYAMQDTRSPVIIAFCAMLLNILLNFALIGPLGYRGLAISTTISYSINCLVLYFLLHHRIGNLWNREYVETLIRIITATIFMGAVTYGTWMLSARWFDEATLIGRGLIAFLPIGASVVAYATLSKALAIPEFEHFLEGLKRRTGRK